LSFRRLQEWQLKIFLSLPVFCGGSGCEEADCPCELLQAASATPFGAFVCIVMSSGEFEVYLVDKCSENKQQYGSIFGVVVKEQRRKIDVEQRDFATLF